MANSSWGLRNLPILGSIWRRIEAVPKPVPEDSLVLRIMVQALVITGIVAVDVAAGVGTDRKSVV